VIQIKEPWATSEVISTFKPLEVYDVKAIQDAANIPPRNNSRAAPSDAMGGAARVAAGL
jgi:hypothetical protein